MEIWSVTKNRYPLQQSYLKQCEIILEKWKCFYVFVKVKCIADTRKIPAFNTEQSFHREIWSQAGLRTAFIEMKNDTSRW